MPFSLAISIMCLVSWKFERIVEISAFNVTTQHSPISNVTTIIKQARCFYIRNRYFENTDNIQTNKKT